MDIQPDKTANTEDDQSPRKQKVREGCVRMACRRDKPMPADRRQRQQHAGERARSKAWVHDHTRLLRVPGNVEKTDVRL